MMVDKTDIYKLLKRDQQYSIPVFQRLYSWERAQCKRLWYDIIAMKDQNEKKKGHFLGSIVCIAEKTSPTGVQKYMVIDG